MKILSAPVPASLPPFSLSLSFLVQLFPIEGNYFGNYRAAIEREDILLPPRFSE